MPVKAKMVENIETVGVDAKTQVSLHSYLLDRFQAPLS